eukprot:391209-Pelagomonas_calceolata.AAC.3
MLVCEFIPAADQPKPWAVGQPLITLITLVTQAVNTRKKAANAPYQSQCEKVQDVIQGSSNPRVTREKLKDFKSGRVKPNFLVYPVGYDPKVIKSISGE